MGQIEKLDPNFKAPGTQEGAKLTYRDCLQPPFSLHGLLPPEQAGEPFLRMPPAAAARMNAQIQELNAHTSGGRLRFVSDSPVVAVRVRLNAVGRMAHFALCGSAGFDLYMREGTEQRYAGTFIPPYAMRDSYEASLQLPEGDAPALREFTLNFPLYSGVCSLQIGLAPGASLLPAGGYRYAQPVVYYGSSITQGGCASRPGNAYPAVLSRMLDCDFVNLGFSGNAKGETEMAEYIAGLPMSAFVYDYDHNAGPELLQRTHGQMFRIIRDRQPQLPVIMVSRPQPYLNEQERTMRRIIEDTFCSALQAGDKNVYFIDGSRLLHRFGGDSGTVDRCHPNDLGFMCMAQGIRETLQRALESAEAGR